MSSCPCPYVPAAVVDVHTGCGRPGMPEIGNAAQSRSCGGDVGRRFLVGTSLPWIVHLAAAFGQISSGQLGENSDDLQNCYL
jgi:hypothetical protein